MVVSSSLPIFHTAQFGLLELQGENTIVVRGTGLGAEMSSGSRLIFMQTSRVVDFENDMEELVGIELSDILACRLDVFGPRIEPSHWLTGGSAVR